ncbi:uncharacterized protein LOC143018602 [Oratosquilla oratoria]|uniref:uncharacterized protein LOC143018602 n=1 Tax=Oratosquilla oratoria TaxID=337810 RepID=UPI003F772009
MGMPLGPSPPEVLLFSDASKEGWGAHLNDDHICGSWSTVERTAHINWLELKAVLLALRHFKDQVSGKVVGIMSDNSSVVAYLNEQGGHSLPGTMPSDDGHPQPSQESPGVTQSPLHPGEEECLGGPPRQEESDNQHRMVPLSRGSELHPQQMGLPSSGPFCNEMESPTPNISALSWIL